MRNILKEFVFPADVRALPPADDRTPLIFQIVSNLFNEITFYIFNILIGENTTTGSFYVFFSGISSHTQILKPSLSPSAATPPSMSSCRPTGRVRSYVTHLSVPMRTLLNSS
jgi:hypothetical protein